MTDPIHLLELLDPEEHGAVQVWPLDAASASTCAVSPEPSTPGGTWVAS